MAEKLLTWVKVTPILFKAKNRAGDYYWITRNVKAQKYRLAVGKEKPEEIVLHNKTKRACQEYAEGMETLYMTEEKHDAITIKEIVSLMPNPMKLTEDEKLGNRASNEFIKKIMDDRTEAEKVAKDVTEMFDRIQSKDRPEDKRKRTEVEKFADGDKDAIERAEAENKASNEIRCTKAQSEGKLLGRMGTPITPEMLKRWDIIEGGPEGTSLENDTPPQ